MLDLALLSFLLAFLAMGIRRPFLWVLAYLYVDILAPQKIGWTLMPSLPVSLLVFVAAFGGWLFLEKKRGARFSFRQGLLLALLIYCGLTTATADFPQEALTKWDWVWKALVFAIFMPLTLTTRLRLESAALVMVLSAGAIIIGGGIKTVFAGGGYGTLALLVRENSGLYEGSTLSAVAIAIIPLIVWLARSGTIFPPGRMVTLFAAALIFACLLIPIGTATRTGLVCIAVLGALTLRSTRHRFLFVSLAGFALLASIPFLPQSYLDRMSTIEQHEADQSASTRLAVWAWTLDYVKENPLGGGFDAYRGNSFTYRTRAETTSGGTTTVETMQVTEEARAYHSAYFEMLGEQGWPGLLLWMAFHGLGLLQMERIRARYRKSESEDDRRLAGLANALQQGHIVYLVGAMFVGIAFQPFIYMYTALEIGLASFLRVRGKHTGAENSGARRQTSAQAAEPGPLTDGAGA